MSVCPLPPAHPHGGTWQHLVAFLEEPPATDGFAEGRRVLYPESWYFSCTWNNFCCFDGQVLPVFVLLFHWPWVCAGHVSFQAGAGTHALHLWLTSQEFGAAWQAPGTWRDSLCSHSCQFAEVAAAQATSAQRSGGCSACSEVCRTCGEPQHHKAWVLFAVILVVLGNPVASASNWPLGFTARTLVSAQVKQKAHLSVLQESSQGGIVNLLLLTKQLAAVWHVAQDSSQSQGFPGAEKDTGRSHGSWTAHSSLLGTMYFKAEKLVFSPLDTQS